MPEGGARSTWGVEGGGAEQRADRSSAVSVRWTRFYSWHRAGAGNHSVLRLNMHIHVLRTYPSQSSSRPLGGGSARLRLHDLVGMHQQRCVPAKDR
jgi:hypothetical protein